MLPYTDVPWNILNLQLSLNAIQILEPTSSCGEQSPTTMQCNAIINSMSCYLYKSRDTIDVFCH
jgi:hypothetical protein